MWWENRFRINGSIDRVIFTNGLGGWNEQTKTQIENGEVYLGIELGSTRIKAVLLNEEVEVLSQGSHTWENQLKNGIWTYDLESAWAGLQACYADLAKNIKNKYGVCLRKIRVIGISGMMHGYLPFDDQGNQLAMFRTWRNNMTEAAADRLTDLFAYNIPQRWSIAHLYQCILDGEAHVKNIAYLTTLAGYVHWRLTGEKVLGIGEASGMFPIDTKKKDYRPEMLEKFDALIEEKGYPWKLKEILPAVKCAGENGGRLSPEGAKLLDVSGQLQPGCRMCPPEADGGTGMVATNSVAKRTGNVSAGTSAFAMIVLEQELSKVYRQLDLVTTPSGDLVAMAHADNCTTEINGWMHLFREVLNLAGVQMDDNTLYEIIFRESLKGDLDGGGLVSYGFHSGEHGVHLNNGCPLFLHPTEASFHLANFVKSQLYSCFGAMKLGVDFLLKEECVKVDRIVAQGGIFNTKEVAQRYLAATLETPVQVMENAGEGGPWGMAVLASYMDHTDLSLEAYLQERVFAGSAVTEIQPTETETAGYKAYMKAFKKAIPAAKAAAEYSRETYMAD